eukprot:5374674-Prymnesium_polylepis.1
MGGPCLCRPAPAARTVHQAVSAGNSRESVANLREPRTCANCANVRTRRESATNLSRIRKTVANLSRTRPTRCEL